MTETTRAAQTGMPQCGRWDGAPAERSASDRRYSPVVAEPLIARNGRVKRCERRWSSLRPVRQHLTPAELPQPAEPVQVPTQTLCPDATITGKCAASQ